MNASREVYVVRYHFRSAAPGLHGWDSTQSEYAHLAEAERAYDAKVAEVERSRRAKSVLLLRLYWPADFPKSPAIQSLVRSWHRGTIRVRS